MSKTIGEWQKLIAAAANQKFTDNKNWSMYDRISSIQSQLDDVLCAVKVEDGVLESKDHAHQDPDHRVAALIADILILAEMRKIDIDFELQKVLNWFEN